MISFSTARLVLRPPEEPDVEPLMAMDADPEVMRYIGNGAIIPPDRDRVLQAVSRWRKQWDEQGYATEAAAELLRFGLTEAGLDRVVSIRDIDNGRSERVMAKLGLQFELQTTVPATGQRVAVHAIARHQFGVHDSSSSN